MSDGITLTGDQFKKVAEGLTELREDLADFEKGKGELSDSILDAYVSGWFSGRARRNEE